MKYLIFTRHLIWMLLPFLAFTEQFAAAERCTQVNILAEVKTQYNTYSQRGVGVVYASNPQTIENRILIPSHVVFGAQKVSALCGKEKLPVEITGQSITADIAVGKIVNARTPSLKPLFFSSGEATIANTTRLKTHGEILVPSASDSLSFRKVPVNFFVTYNYSYMNPIFGDQPGYLLSSGVIPGMSGSVFLIDNQFAGVITKSITNESLSAAVSAKEILTLIPSLEKGVDPYQYRPAFLTSELIENGATKSLHRLHHLHVKTSHGWIEYRDSCESSHWTATSNWVLEGGGWGESGGGWGEGSGPGKRAKSDKMELIEGLDIPTSEEQEEGRQPVPVSYFLPGKSSCEKEGVTNKFNGKRLVGLLNYEDEFTAGKTLRINNVDDLMPLAQKFSEVLPEILEQHGIFADDVSSPLTNICSSRAFKNTNFLRSSGFNKLQIETNSSASGKEIAIFWEHHLERTSSKGSESSEGSESYDSSRNEIQSSMECNQNTKQLRFKMTSQEIPLNFDLQISSQFLNGFIQFGSCRIDLNQHKKDFWQAEINSAEMDWGLDLGLTIKDHGIIHLIPRRISPRCLKGTEFESSITRPRVFTWIAD